MREKESERPREDSHLEVMWMKGSIHVQCTLSTPHYHYLHTPLLSLALSVMDHVPLCMNPADNPGEAVREHLSASLTEPQATMARCISQDVWKYAFCLATASPQCKD
ncbi:hypothetical protein MHYP_G00270530 [Metynnis hypsauchen]